MSTVKRDTLQALVRELGDLLSPHLPGGTQAWLFGSWARREAVASSDVDVAVLPAQPMPPDWLVDARLALEESTLPYVVDLVDLSQVGPDFRQRVLQEGIAIPLE